MEGPRVLVTKLPSGKNRIVVEGIRASLRREWETHYPEWLIARILEARGPAFLCDEIARDESPEYTRVALMRMLLAYLDEAQFERARILDFGCGAGAGTVALSRSFPHAHIVGVELNRRSVEVARGRCSFYGFNNVEFFVSPSGKELPRDIGTFDFVVLSGVFEHLLPEERTAVMPMLWDALEPGGTLFIHETPNRLFPLETHTTWLPFINYLPAPLAHYAVRRCCRGRNRELDWPGLLRRGIRGGSIREIRRLLPGAKLLRPSRNGIRDLVDLWYATTPKDRRARAKRVALLVTRALKVAGIECPPYLELAIEKPR